MKQHRLPTENSVQRDNVHPLLQQSHTSGSCCHWNARAHVCPVSKDVSPASTREENKTRAPGRPLLLPVAAGHVSCSPQLPPSPGCDTGAVAAPPDAVRSQHGAEGLRQIHSLWLFYIAFAVPAHEPQTQTSPLWVQSLSQSPRKGMQRQNHAKSHTATRQKQSIMGRHSMRGGQEHTSVRTPGATAQTLAL